MIRVQLLIGGNKYNVTDCLVNWEDVETSLKRKDFGGVYRSFGDSFEFCGDAYLLLEKEFLTNYLNASAVIVVGLLNNAWTYNEKFRCNLDFSSYQNNGSTINIKAIDSTAEAIINANKSQVYDIPVANLKENELYYDRMELKNKADFVVIPTEEQFASDFYTFILESSKKGPFMFPLGYSTTNFPVKNKIDVGDTPLWTNPPEDNFKSNYLIKGLTEISVVFKFSFDIQVGSMSSQNEYINFLVMKYHDTNNGEIESTTIEKIQLNSNSFTSLNKEYNIDLRNNDRIFIALEPSTSGSVNIDTVISVNNVKEISVSYLGRNKPVTFDVFTPNKLLTALLSNMGLSDMTGEVEAGDLPIPYMIAAESIRDITDAKVHTSFSKFTDWAKACLGYYYAIEGKKVVFRHLSKLYDPDTVKELEYVNGINVSVNSSLIYSGVEVGYDKKEYDEINGRDEFHVKNSFSTGVSINDNVYKLVSPYRADCYGIEFLAQKRDEETKDDSSDNDLFFVDAVVQSSGGSNRLVLNRSGYAPSGVLFPESVFNAAYSPRRMLIANKEYISSCTKLLTFTATEGNADVVLAGESEKDPVRMDEHFFRVETISVETIGLSQIPSLYDGLISFDYNGKTYSGYVSDITEHLGKKQSTEYELICKEIKG